MKRITFTADEGLIERARSVARAQNTSLGAAFRDWLRQYVEQDGRVTDLNTLMNRLKHVRAGGPFTRDQMNER
jgi:hypothetical protein